MRALTLSFALLLICTGAAVAQTPDWMTPSEETICDSETGAAYGLCNAYCEAMDCELANDSDPLTVPSASATACSKVQSKFTNVTGRSLPCETCPPPPPGTTCPCVDALPDFALALSTPGECVEFGPAAVKYTELAWAGATCSLPETSLGGVCATLSPNGYNLLEVTPAEGQACAQLIRESCTPE
jgi:hypothetical protein